MIDYMNPKLVLELLNKQHYSNSYKFTSKNKFVKWYKLRCKQCGYKGKNHTNPEFSNPRICYLNCAFPSNPIYISIINHARYAAPCRYFIPLQCPAIIFLQKILQHNLNIVHQNEFLIFL